MPLEDTRRLRDIILDQCEAKEIRMEELVKKSGIPEQYLDAIINDVRTRLPAFPYIRVHLNRIAVLLGLPPERLLAQYRKEFSEKQSGGADALPGNRFALPSGFKRYVSAAVVVVVVLMIIAISRSGFFGIPHLTISMPPAGSDPFITNSSTIILSGRVDEGDKLLINGQDVATGKDGVFSSQYPLTSEINVIEFTTKRFLGRELSITRQVYYDEPTSTPAVKAAVKKTVKVIEAATTTPAEAPEP
jgi:hypothetical protein